MGVVVSLVGDDWVSIVSELGARVKELRERLRLNCLSFGEGIELVCTLKKLEECKERRMMVVEENFWNLVREVKEKAGMEAYRENVKLLKPVKRQRATESHRFAGSVLKSANLVPFSSGRML